MGSSARAFTDAPATRERVPLIVGLTGASGSGKTFSALRLATGIQRVYGGNTYFIDTEARRALHYADRFTFRHVPFSPPFGPADYQSAIEHCVKQGAQTIVIDSMSHEHAGQGGVLEMHDAEMQRLSRGDEARAERVKMLAWQRPKAERQRLINAILQAGVNFVLCFRAKEKLKLERGKEPTQLGWMPVAGEEYVFEATVSILLEPASGGVPTWRPQHPGEKIMVKMPEQFRDVFHNEPLSEDVGQRIAEWAAGGPATPATVDAPKKQRQGMKRLHAAVGALPLVDAAVSETVVDKAEYARGRRLAWLSWAIGRNVESSNDLTDAEILIATDRAEKRDMP